LARLRFTPSALADLAAISAYIAEDSPNRARTLIERIIERCQILKTFTTRGRPRPEFGADVRAFPVRPFVIFCRIRDDDKVKDVEVLRIIDRRRDLGTIFAEDIQRIGALGMTRERGDYLFVFRYWRSSDAMYRSKLSRTKRVRPPMRTRSIAPLAASCLTIDFDTPPRYCSVAA
jgi:plasmid stabilization system protein ParE